MFPEHRIVIPGPPPICGMHVEKNISSSIVHSEFFLHVLLYNKSVHKYKLEMSRWQTDPGFELAKAQFMMGLS